MKKFLLVTTSIFLLAAACNKQQVSSYDDCIKAGGQALNKAIPQQCSINSKIFFSTIKPEPQTSVQTKPADETADWKTYTNSDYGFEFKYPSIWSISDAQNSQKGPSLRFKYQDGSDHAIFSIYKKNYEQQALPDSYKPIVIDGISGLAEKLVVDGQISDTIYLEKANAIYTLSFGTSPDHNFDKYKDAYQNLINTILDTFKFSK